MAFIHFCFMNLVPYIMYIIHILSLLKDNFKHLINYASLTITLTFLDLLDDTQ